MAEKHAEAPPQPVSRLKPARPHTAPAGRLKATLPQLAPSLDTEYGLSSSKTLIQLRVLEACDFPLAIDHLRRPPSATTHLRRPTSATAHLRQPPTHADARAGGRAVSGPTAVREQGAASPRPPLGRRSALLTASPTGTGLSRSGRTTLCRAAGWTLSGMLDELGLTLEEEATERQEERQEERKQAERRALDLRRVRHLLVRALRLRATRLAVAAAATSRVSRQRSAKGRMADRQKDRTTSRRHSTFDAPNKGWPTLPEQVQAEHLLRPRTEVERAQRAGRDGVQPRERRAALAPLLHGASCSVQQRAQQRASYSAHVAAHEAAAQTAEAAAQAAELRREAAHPLLCGWAQHAARTGIYEAGPAP